MAGNGGRFITLDTETRSFQDIDVGPSKYFEHPSTDMLCAAWLYGMDDEVQLWHRATEGIDESPFPAELFRRIDEGWLVEAHNAMFERQCFDMMWRRFGWPRIPVDRWRCTAALAAYHCLPRALEDAADVAQLEQRKDPEGKALIRALSRPQVVEVPGPRKGKSRKERKVDTAWRLAHEDMAFSDAMGEPSRYFDLPDGSLARWNEDQALIRRNWDYCKQDVRTERELGLYLPALPERELRVWRMDQEMNARGVRVDLELCRSAIEVATGEAERLNARLGEIIPGVDRGTQRARVLAWLQARCPFIENTQGDHLDKVLGRKDLPAEVREAISIMAAVNKSSLAKYRTMEESACEDGCIRDLVMYAGAHTLRWTGKNVQPHNFPRGGIKDMVLATDVVKTRDVELMRLLYKNVMALLSHSLRGALIARRDRRLWVADFAAIEARVVFWLAQCWKALQVFEDEKLGNPDMYCSFASRIYGRPITKADKDPRQMGKQSILGLGFGMGFCKFLITLRKYRISFTKEQVLAIVGTEEAREIATWIKRRDRYGGAQYVRRSGLDLERDLVELVLTKYVVDLYRGEYEEVPAFWKQQEAAAIEAATSRGSVVEAGMVKWERDGRRLLAHLPSGTDQTYWDPEVRMEPRETENDGSDWLRYKVVDDGTLEALVRLEQAREKQEKRYPRLYVHALDQKTKQWTRFGTYGGEITENLVQHTARDIMADAMVRIEDSPTYENILSVHDEELAESGRDEGSAEEFHELISRREDWNLTCPIDAEVMRDIVTRYKKG